MSCVVVGPGLVGCYLGAAAGSPRVVLGPNRRLASRAVDLPLGRVIWQPEAVEPGLALPHLVCTRVPQTPWDRLPPDSLLAQNGLGQPLPCIASFMALDLDGDGVIRSHGPSPRLAMADPGPSWQGTIRAWRAAGITVEIVPDVLPRRWEKTILNATVGPLCLATGRTMAEVWADRDLRALTLAATREGMQLARDQGIAVGEDFCGRAESFFAAAGDHRPSVVRNPCELPWVLGHLESRIDGRAREFPALMTIIRLAAAVTA